jgi:hypothetical protein
MGWIRIIAPTIGLLLIGSVAQAGIFSTLPGEQMPVGFTPAQFENYRTLYLAAAVRQTPVHKAYLERIKEIEERGQTSGLSTDDRINLSAYYLRIQEPEKAVNVLTPVATPEKRNFMVLSNLATAQFMAGRAERAAEYAELALKEWPSSWPGFTHLQLSWYYRAEKYFMTLLRARAREERLNPGKPPETLDDLFPGVRFVGPSGQYEAGIIDPIQMARLPGDNLPAIEQLVLWLPADARIYWLLGEVFNSSGNVVDATRVLSDLTFNRRFSPKELRDHLHVLEESQPGFKAINDGLVRDNEYYRLLWAVSPRGGGAPGASPFVNEAGYAFGLSYMRPPKGARAAPAEAIAAPGSSTSQTTNKQPWVPELRHVIVSFLAGVALTVLGGMQWREMKRRREGAAAGSRG